MPSFKCKKPTTHKGRMVAFGAVVNVREKAADPLRGHPCWDEQEAQEVDPVEEQETLRLELLAKARDMGLKPNARTGVPKLQDMIEKAGSIV